MPDLVPSETSDRMRRIRRVGTSGELFLESMLSRCAPSFQRQVRIATVTPDFVFPRERVAIFVDGDFWHGRIGIESGEAALKRSFRGKRSNFWFEKILRNIDRDRRQVFQLRRQGWSVLRFWERDLRLHPDDALAAIRSKLKKRRARLRRSKPNAF